MKNSGIPWIGEIPEKWKVMRHKWIMHKEKQLMEHYNGEPILSLTMQGVIVRDLDAGGKMPTSFDGYQVVFPNDLLQCLFDIDVTPRCVGLVKHEGLVSPAYTRFVMHKEANAAYYDYLLRFMDDNKVLLHLSKNIRSSLTETDYGAISTCVPPIEEQQSIVDFLDKKCAEIDQMVALQEKFIEELKAYKQSLITETVTKGLNPNAPMKDSGVEWIGEIPEGWKVQRLKKHFVFEKGKNAAIYTTEYVGEHKGRYPVYSGQTENDGIMGLIDTYDYDIRQCLFTTTVGAKVMTPKILYGKFSLSQNCMIMHSKSEVIDVRYVFYLLHKIFQYAKSLIPTYMQPSLRVEDMKTYRMLLPPLSEQQAIADYLDKKCAEIDQLITIKQKKADELREYKKSIIYEYVTGKRSVCE